MIIRPAEIEDARAIASIHVRSWQHTYKDILPADGLSGLSIDERAQQWAGWLRPEASPMHVLVAEENGEVVGFASWGPTPEDEETDPDTVMLYSIYVSPDFVSLGIGSALLESIEVDMITNGAHAAILSVLAENTPTHRFYERHGWKKIEGSARQETYYGMEMATIRYRKSLS